MPGSVTAALLRSFDPTAVLILNLCGTFVFGISGGLYAIPALIEATIVVVAQRAGQHGLAWPLVGVATCFAVRVTAIRYDLSLPAARPQG